MKLAGSLLVGLMAMGVAQASMAQIDGVYKSDGTDGCTITITKIDMPSPQFGDAYWRIESRGLSSCMWDSVGISHSTDVVGGTISLPPISPRGLLHMKWSFGPASKQVELKQLGVDGVMLAEQTYTRQ